MTDSSPRARLPNDWGSPRTGSSDRFEAGDVPGYRFGRKGGPVRFLWSDWEGFLQRCRVGPTLKRQLHQA